MADSSTRDHPPVPETATAHRRAPLPVSSAVSGTHVVRRPVRPRPTTGRWRTVKNQAMTAILLLFFTLPHIPWPRPDGQPQQALLFDFVGGHAYAGPFRFGYEDLLLLMGLLLVSAMALFFTNTLVGRVWCGFACPQTLWTDLFRKIDHYLVPKVGKGGSKFIWALVSLATSLTILAYFAPATTLWPAIFSGEAAAHTYALLLLFGLATYFLATLVQDMVCTHFCPWPRFQAVMVDRDTKIVTYQAWRGEPRGPVKRSLTTTQPKGDCVACNLCVKVCPMGIDIREGSQLACIGCGLCADACDQVMEKLGLEQGLIRFSSDREQERANSGSAPPRPRWRARTLGYGAMMLLVSAIILPVYLGRTGVIVHVTPDRAGAYVTLSDGSIRNVYALSVQDGRNPPGPLLVTVDGIKDADIRISTPGASDHGNRIPAPSGRDNQENYRLLVTVPAAAVDGQGPISFRFTPIGETKPVTETRARFLAPALADGGPGR